MKSGRIWLKMYYMNLQEIMEPQQNTARQNHVFLDIVYMERMFFHIFETPFTNRDQLRLRQG